MQKSSHTLIAKAATELKISERQVYILNKRCRTRDGDMVSLEPDVSSGEKGNQRIGNVREAMR